MRTFSNQGGGGFGFNIQMTPGVKSLLIANIGVFVVTAFTRDILPFWLGLTPALVMKGFLWQMFTYQFLHEGIGHILFNMLALWMFGTVIEGTWGRQRFLRYYFICGTGAGLCVVLAGLLGSGFTATTVGASGAIYGLLLAFGVMYPNAPILLFFLFPVPAKYAVIIYGAISFFLFSSGSGGNVSHIAHLGGMLVGYIYMKYAGFTRTPRGYFQRRFSLGSSLAGWRARYQEWNRRRLRKKFEVYMRDQDRNDHIN
jgi:membrane associated rhomboid family serine protease